MYIDQQQGSEQLQPFAGMSAFITRSATLLKSFFLRIVALELMSMVIMGVLSLALYKRTMPERRPVLFSAKTIQICIVLARSR